MIRDWPPNSQYKATGEGMQFTVLLNTNKCIKIKKKGNPKQKRGKGNLQDESQDSSRVLPIRENQNVIGAVSSPSEETDGIPDMFESIKDFRQLKECLA